MNDKLKELFAVKENHKVSANVDENPTDDLTKISCRDHGFQEAGRLKGSMNGLLICLRNEYHAFCEKIKKDAEKQAEIQNSINISIEEHKGDNERLSKQVNQIKTEQIPLLKEKIEFFKNEYSTIRENPQNLMKDEVGKVSFIIGCVILAFLTIYLFVFYSSVSYSAFFKIFELDDIGVVRSLFEPKSIELAFHEGLFELVFILTIPFIFLGLGYIIHKLMEWGNYRKYIAIISFVFLTFIFDTILAYDICKKIYDIEAVNTFIDIPPFSLSIAFKSVNFWLIIFAGFIVYIIWGIVFHFTMDTYSKLNPLRVALQEKRKQIKNEESEMKSLESQIYEIQQKIGENMTKINKLNKMLENTFYPEEFERYIYNFSSGWMAWMKQSGLHDDLSEAKRIIEQFVENINQEKINTI
jgi:predicted  nucleic acid-binding Zn-ribbon protein